MPMKTILLSAAVLFSLILHSQVTFHPDDLSRIAKGEQETHVHELMPPEKYLSSLYDVTGYRIFWQVDPSVDYITGMVTTLFIPKQPAFDSLVLDLSDSLSVDSVVYRSQTIAWTHSSNRLTLFFPSVLPQNIQDSVSVFYQGKPPFNGFDSFVQGNHNGAPLIWTLSEPYGASDWWPCKNGLTDKADSLDIIISVPSPFVAVSNGILVSDSTTGNHRIWHWKHHYPIASYLVCLGVTNYVTYSQQVVFGIDTLNVINYVYPEDSASAASQTGWIIPMIQLYDHLFGMYPFQNEKYGHAEFGGGGGMEHQTITFVSDFGFELLAHELGHQWFGDKITCGTWSDIWLNEGFATYLSGLCYEHLAPQYWTQFRKVRIGEITAKPDGSVFCTDTTNVSRIFDSRLSYAKGAMILHQLRQIIGDTDFFAALYYYMNDPLVAYGFARTSNLKDHFESSCGHDLTWYFDDWYTGQGFPSYRVNWQQDGDTVSFAVVQTQSDPSVSFFMLPLEIKLKNNSHDTLIRVNNTYSGQVFKAAIPFSADSLIFDPDWQIISGNNTVNAINEHTFPERLNIWPNPAGTHIYLFSKSASGKMSYSIYSSEGRLVKQGYFMGGVNQISIINLPDGLYSLQSLEEGRSNSGTFVVKH